MENWTKEFLSKFPIEALPCTPGELLLHEIIGRFNRSSLLASFKRGHLFRERRARWRLSATALSPIKQPPQCSHPSHSKENIFRRDRRVSVVHSTGRKRLPKESIDLWNIYPPVCSQAIYEPRTATLTSLVVNLSVTPQGSPRVCVFRCCSRATNVGLKLAREGRERKTLVVKKNAESRCYGA